MTPKKLQIEDLFCRCWNHDLHLHYTIGQGQWAGIKSCYAGGSQFPSSLQQGLVIRGNCRHENTSLLWDRDTPRCQEEAREGRGGGIGIITLNRLRRRKHTSQMFMFFLHIITYKNMMYTSWDKPIRWPFCLL